MRLRYPYTLRPFFFSSKLSTMTPQTLFHSSPFPTLKNTPFCQRHRFLPHRPFFTVFCSKPTSRNSSSPLRTNGYIDVSHASIPRPVQLANSEAKSVELQFNILRKKLEAVGMETGICVPGQKNHLICPKCQGGDQSESSLSLYIAPDWGSAAWVCFRGKCGWKGSTQAFAGRRSAASIVTPVKKKREITEEELQLEPLCDELLAYFSERLISKETLERNAVKQRRYADQIVIAFTYLRNGSLISCKYRDVNKVFWQVQGEMDKLAMEEAGFLNCVSVPDEAPPSVSSTDLPPQEHYQLSLNLSN